MNAPKFSLTFSIGDLVRLWYNGQIGIIISQEKLIEYNLVYYIVYVKGRFKECSIDSLEII